MSIGSSILQNKWLAGALSYVQSALQVLLFVLIVICLAVAWWRYQNTVFVISKVKVDTDSTTVNSGAVLNGHAQPVDFYLDLVAQRDIFRFVSLDQSGGMVATQDVPSQAGQDLANRFVVQGIVLDRNPMAIIKDIQSNKTYFLHRSEILEGAQLVDIRENRVIFDRNGETLELIKK